MRRDRRDSPEASARDDRRRARGRRWRRPPPQTGCRRSATSHPSRASHSATTPPMRLTPVRSATLPLRSTARFYAVARGVARRLRLPAPVQVQVRERAGFNALAAGARVRRTSRHAARSLAAAARRGASQPPLQVDRARRGALRAPAAQHLRVWRGRAAASHLRTGRGDAGQTTGIRSSTYGDRRQERHLLIDARDARPQSGGARAQAVAGVRLRHRPHTRCRAGTADDSSGTPRWSYLGRNR